MNSTSIITTGYVQAVSATGSWLATQTEAETGTNNDQLMTPLRTQQAINIAIPTGAIMAFDLTSCPSGWSVYTAARGRFLRGIDNSTGTDPDGNRAPGNTQADMLGSHTHTAYAPTSDQNDASTQGWPVGNVHNTFRTSDRSRDYAVNSQAISLTGGAETRPKNVAVLFCRKN
ncbi:MAG: hypothetical protein DI585_01590 [Pseudomonas fluorescens]|nr:MAG: hypothetical protein DI585_01590 [Pseudomonas fluorescens]